MSLLIKALQKAEEEKKSDGKGVISPALELAPIDDELQSENPQPRSFIQPGDFSKTKSGQRSQTQQAASQVFAAKSKQQQNTAMLWLVLLVVVLLLLLGGFYYYLESLKKPELIPTTGGANPSLTNSLPPTASPILSIDPEQRMVPELQAEPVIQSAESPVAAVQATTVQPGAMEELAARPSPASVPATKPEPAPKPVVFGDEPPAIPREVQVTRNTPEPAINPHLLEGYNAFQRGDDVAAQRAYRNVLQTDIRNIDALLGMAAIAARQSRVQDAAGWYARVLEIEPRNSFAQAAMASLMGQLDPVSNETRLKNMIAQQPDAAHLHASLGHLYVTQQLWPQAQQAYFEAHRLDARNPEHAYNLAISMDHMGKPALALQYYQLARSLAMQSPSPALDLATLEARIQQLQ